MKKFLNSIKFALIGLFVCLLSVSAVAQRVTLDFTTNSWNLPTTNSSEDAMFTSGEDTIAIHPATSFRFVTSGSYLILGKTNSTLTLPVFDFAVSKIEVEGRNGASAAVTQNIYVGSTAVSTATTGATSTNVYEIASAYQAAGTVYVLKVTSNHNTQITKIKVYEATSTAVDAPTFSVAEGTYYEPFNLTLSTTTSNASIYYTTDGTTPTVNSTRYTTPIVINTTTTVKALAVADNATSSMVSATYTFPVEVADIATFKTTAQSNVEYKIVGDVTYVFRHGRYMFVQDATGGLLIYDYSSPNISTTYNEGDVISGGIYGKISVYNGLTEMVPTRNTASATVNNGSVTPTEVTAANLIDYYSTYESMLVKVNDVTFTGNLAFTQNGSDMALYDRFGTLTTTRENGDEADVIGFLCAYGSSKQIYPRDDNDIILSVVSLPYTENFESQYNSWTLNNGTADNVWTVGQGQGFDNGKLFITSSNGATNKYVNSAADVTASLDAIIPETGATLTFDYRVAGESGHDYLQVEITKNGVTTILAQLSDQNDWTGTSIDIYPQYAGESTITLRWVNDANGTINQFPAAVDNITLTEAPCAQPTTLNATVTGTTANVTWTPGSGQTAWIFEYKLADHTDWYSKNVTNASVTLNNLQGNSAYDMRVRANCGDNLSPWAYGTFTVDCQNLSVIPSDIVIGTGTSNDYIAPFNNFYNYSWTQTIYPASEFSSGNIYSIAWQCATTGSLTLSTVNIYLGTTSDDTHTSTSSWLPLSDLTLVYSGTNVAIGASTGWQTFTFDTPFNYSGTGNLVIVVAKTADSYSGAIKYYYTSSSYSVLYRRSDYYTDYASHPGTSTGTRTSMLPNIKVNMDLISCGDQALCSEPTNLTVSDVTTTTANIAWNAGDAETAWIVSYKTVDESDWTTVNTAADYITLMNLTPNADYEVRVKAVCGEENYSNNITAAFSTLATCMAPTNISNVNSGTNSTIYWTANANETAWVVEFKTATSTEWISVNVTNEPLVVLSNLEGNTLYDVRVKAVCSATDESEWVNYQFVTNCQVYTLPYAIGFEEDDQNSEPACWDFLNNHAYNSSTYPSAYVNNSSTYVHTGSKSLYFKSSAGTPLYAIFPEIDGNDVSVNFWYRNEGTTAYNGTLSIGTMSNPEDASSFVTVATYDRISTFTEVNVNIQNLNGARIAFKYEGGTSSNYYLGIDDITVSQFTNCDQPFALTVSDITTTGATIGWTGTADSYEIEYGVSGFMSGAGTTVSSSASTITLSNLVANTTYDVYVRAICGTGQSSWSSVQTFTTTACEEANKCIFTLNMTDSYGDGWNGAYLNVLMDGQAYDSYTVDNGTSNSVNFGLCDNQVMTFTWTTGSYDSECSYELLLNGSSIYSGSGAQSGVFFTQNGCSVDNPDTPSGCTIDLPYSESFETYTTNAEPDCWTFVNNNGYNTSSNYPMAYVNTSSLYIHSGSKSLYFRSKSGESVYAIMPEINANGAVLSFYYRNEGTTAYNGTLSVGTITDTTDATTFTAVQTLARTTTFTLVEVTFTNLNGARIAFQYAGGTSNNYYLGLDDIVLEEIPSCVKPSITSVVATQTTATVTVGTTTTASSYEVVCVPTGGDPDAATPVTVDANNMAVFTGLTNSTNYDAFARAICSATDISTWSLAYTFNTECGPMSLPYSENFDGITSTASMSTSSMPLCWDRTFTGTSTYYGSGVWASSTYAYSGTNSLHLYAYKTTSTSASYGDVYVILPELDIDLSVVEMSFMVRSVGTSAYYSGYYEVGVVTDPSDPINSFVPVEQTLYTQSTTYQPVTVSFTNYTGANGRIAFKATKNTAESYAITSTYGYTNIYIDDINVEQVIFNQDIELVSAEAIEDACDLSNQALTITVKNNNTIGEISNFTASYTVNGSTTVTENVAFTTPLAIGETTNYTFVQPLNLTAAVNTVTVTLSYGGDGNEQNNVLTMDPISLITPSDLPYEEDFTNVTIGRGGWRQIVANENPNKWSIVSGTPTYEANDFYASQAYLISPCLNIPTGNILISYDYNALGVMSENVNTYIGTSTDPSTWTLLESHTNFVNGTYHVDHLFQNTTSDVYYIIVEAASAQGNLGVTFDNFSVKRAYNIVLTTDNNGVTNPTGTVWAMEGSDLNIYALPNAGYHVAGISVNGTQVAAEDANNSNVYTYTLQNVTDDNNVYVTFTTNTLKVVKMVNPVMAYGQFVPAGNDEVNYGATQTLNLTADAHHHLQSLYISNIATEVGTDYTADVVANGTNYTYTFDHVYVDKYVTASFTVDTIGIHYTVYGLGTVDNQVVTDTDVQPFYFDRYEDYGTTFSASFIPATGYHLTNVIINGVEYGSIDMWEFAQLSSTQYVTVVFEKDVYTITTTAYGDGTVPAGETFEYDPAHTYTFTATPNVGTRITSILRNNEALTIANPEATYTENLTNILSNYDYVVLFNPIDYTVTATTGSHGTVSPLGVTSYRYQDMATYTVQADQGYYISSVTVDGVTTTYTPADALTTYTQSFVFLNEAAANHTISATFASFTYNVTVTAGSNGTITPGTNSYNYGATPTFVITPATGYGIADVLVDGVSVGAVSTYTFAALTGDHTISATFSQYAYTITASAGNGGTITPTGVVNATHGGSQSFSIAPATGYTLADVYVDGVSVGNVSQYSFTNIEANHTIFAQFSINEYTVTVTQPNHGAITPGTMTVTYGATPTFVVTPDVGYSVTAITVNGTNVLSNAVNTNGVYTYTMNAVTANSTITATMTQKTFSITKSAGANGSINGPTTVNYGAEAAYTIVPDNGYEVDQVTVDGMNMGAVTSYIFTNVVENHTISATFKLMDCATPTNMHTIDVTTDEATFTWYHPTATSFEVQYKTIDEATFTTATVTGTSYTVANLMPGTTYAWMVRSNCGTNNYSEWTNANLFRTLDEVDIPDNTGIEDYNVNDLVKVYASVNNVYIVNQSGLQIDQVQIFDIYGKLIYNGHVSSSTEVISMNVATGNYLVRLSTEKGMATYKVYITR